jgi:hypothetical protein
MFSDLDVLTALLSSEEFCNIPLKILRRGRDIIQFHEHPGFTVTERLTWIINGAPTFIHEQGWKPWLANYEDKGKGFRAKLDLTYRDLSPYTIFSMNSIDQKPQPWMMPHSRLSFILRFLALNYPPLVGLPIAILFDLERIVAWPKQFVKTMLKQYCPETVVALQKILRRDN